MDHEEDARQRQRRRHGPPGHRGREIEEEECGGAAIPITGDPGSLERLCTVTVRACQLIRPLISAIYDELGGRQPSTSTSSSDLELGGGGRLLPSDDKGGASSSSSSSSSPSTASAHPPPPNQQR